MGIKLIKKIVYKLHLLNTENCDSKKYVYKYIKNTSQETMKTNVLLHK